MSGSGYRHAPLHAPLCGWAELAAGMDIAASTRFATVVEQHAWLREAQAGTEHSMVRLVGDPWSGPCSVQAGGLMVDEPCCEGQSFEQARWEIRGLSGWTGCRCGGCGLEGEPDVWLDVEIDLDTATFDQRGWFAGCELPEAHAFAEAAERGWAAAAAEHQRRAKQAAMELLGRFTAVLNGDAAVSMSRENVLVRVSQVRPEGARELEPILAVGHDPGVVRSGWWDLCDLDETSRWREAAVVIAADSVRAAGRLAEMMLDPAEVRAAMAADREDGQAALADAWERRVDDFVPAWLTDGSVLWELRASRTVASASDRECAGGREPVAF